MRNYAVVARIFNTPETCVFLFEDTICPPDALHGDIKHRVENAVGHLIKDADVEIIHIVTSSQHIDLYQ